MIMLRSIAAAALLLLPACAAMKRAETSVVLRLSPMFEPARRTSPLSVAVAPVQVRGVAGDRRYAYVDRAAPGEIRQAATIFWEEAPARIVERALVLGLRAAGGIATGPDITSDAELRLTTRLDRFEEVTGGGQPVLATVALDATAVAKGSRRVALAGRYCAQEPIADSAGTTRARAFEAAIAKAVRSMADDLALGRSSTASC